MAVGVNVGAPEGSVGVLVGIPGVTVPVGVAVAGEANARALARAVLQKNLGVRRGENVTIEAWTAGLPWAEAFVLESYRLQAKPMLHFVDEETYWAAVEEFPATTLGRVGSHEWAALRETDAYVFLYGPSDAARQAAPVV